MICLEYHIQYRLGETIRIKPIYDVHLGNKYCDVREFKAYLADSGRNTYFVIGGDLWDAISVTDPRYRKSTDNSETDAIINESLDRGYELLQPYKNKIIGIGLGNHEDVVLRRYGVDLTKLLCERLGGKSHTKPKEFPTPLGYSWGLTLRFREGEGRGRSLRVRGHHGWGGGSRTQGADLTKYSKDMASWDADVFLYGHVHRRQTDTIRRLSFNNRRVIARPKIIGICGTFLKTVSRDEYPTYSERAGYPPTEIGGLTLCVKPMASEAKQQIKYWFSDEED